MKFFTNRLFRRFGSVGRLTDVALVGGAAIKFAQHKGLITDETARKLGASDSPAGSSLSIGEMLLVVAAVWRLLKQFRNKPEKVIIDV